MGTLYLVDAHNSTLANSEINDTIPLEEGDSQDIIGSFVVRIPFGLPIDGTPTDLSDLISKKFAATLAYYPGFLYVDYEDGLDATGWDSSTAVGTFLGERMTTTMVDKGIIRSNAVTLTTAPSEAVFTWEIFDITLGDPKEGVLSRSYSELSPSIGVAAQVSFDNGYTWLGVSDGTLFSIPLANRGTDFKVELSNFSGQKVWIGSWAIIY